MAAPAYSVIEFLLSQVRTDTEALIGGSVYFYSPGTTSTTGVEIFLDKDGTQPANNPYTLDGDATAQLYAAGSYRIVIKDVNGVTQFDRDNIYFNAGSDYTAIIPIGNYTDLADAVTQIGSDSVRLIIDEPITVTADLSVPANIVLERIQPGSITVSPGMTLTIVAAPLSDASEWFLGSGTVTVTGYPQDRAWWGESERIDAGGFNIKAASVLASPYAVQNLSFTATVGSKALTVSLKGINGSAPSATNPITIVFRSSTATSSALVVRTVTSATSVVLSSGSTLGLTAAQTSKIYVWAIDYAGTVELALSRMVNWSATELVTTTAEGGAGAADSATTLYSTTARSNVACRLLGNITIQTGATAGEWDNSPTVLSVTPDTNSRGSWTQQYADDSGETQDVPLGSQYYPLISNGATSAPTFQQVSTGSIANLNVTEGKLAASAVAQAKLKTSTVEVYTTSALGENLTLTGAGEYGFYPQVKGAIDGVDTSAATAQIATGVTSTTYVTNIFLTAAVSGGAGYRAYAQQRYVTSSGEVNWLFYRRDKVTKKIKSASVSSDHPCMGNGGDPSLVEHPFPDYDPLTDEIVCINPTDSEIQDIKTSLKSGESLLQVIGDKFTISEKDGVWPTKEVTVGLPEGYDWKMAKDGTLINPIKATVPKPSYVLCKTLVSKGERE